MSIRFGLFARSAYFLEMSALHMPTRLSSFPRTLNLPSAEVSVPAADAAGTVTPSRAGLLRCGPGPGHCTLGGPNHQGCELLCAFLRGGPVASSHFLMGSVMQGSTRNTPLRRRVWALGEGVNRPQGRILCVSPPGWSQPLALRAPGFGPVSCC